jgi:serine/threonine protein kinase
LLDFGIAKLSQGNPTSPGTYFGTARYMAPEQISTDQPIGPAADLFALGVTLFECLTCTHPFDADTLERVLFKIMNEPAPDLLALRPDLPPGLAALVTRLLAKKPAERPSSASTLAAELALFSPHARSAASSAPLETGRGVSVGSRDASRSGRSALLFRALLAGLALTLCIAGALLWARVRRMPPSNSPDVSARPSAALPSVEQREAASPPPIASAANLAVSPTPRSAPPAAPKPIPSAPELPLFFPRQPKTR